MKTTLTVLLAVLLVGCASNPLESKKSHIGECIKDLRTQDDNIKDVFEVCRQIHGLKKVRDSK